jgi:hypothetical protein
VNGGRDHEEILRFFVDKINNFAYIGEAPGDILTVQQIHDFIVEKLLPTVLAWGFAKEDLVRAIALANLPKGFAIYGTRHAKVFPDARHREKMRDRGETFERAAVLDTRTSTAAMQKSSHIFVFVTTLSGKPVLRADWQMLPEPESHTPYRRHGSMSRPPNVDPGHGNRSADVVARRPQRLLDRR